MTTFSNEETRCLNRVAIHHELAELHPTDRAIITLHFRYAIPNDYVGLWPPRLDDIGHYIGRKYRGRRFSAPFAGVVSALFPHAPVVGAVTTALPQLRVAVPLLLISVGSIWAALTHPPVFQR